MDVSSVMNRAIAWTSEYGWVVQIFAVVLITLIVGAIVRRIVLHLIERTKATYNLVDDALFSALHGPSRGLVWVIGLTSAAYIAGSQTEAVIFDALPTVQNFFEICRGKRLHCWPAFKKIFEVGSNRRNGGLLQHDFRQPNAVWIGSLARQRPPRQAPAVAIIPGQQLGGGVSGVMRARIKR